MTCDVTTLARLVAGWACGLLLSLICGCMSSRAGLPLLYADPGVRVERLAQGVISYKKGMVLRTGDVVQTTGSTAVIVRNGYVRCAPRRTGAWPEVVVDANFVLREQLAEDSVIEPSAMRVLSRRSTTLLRSKSITAYPSTTCEDPATDGTTEGAGGMRSGA